MAKKKAIENLVVIDGDLRLLLEYEAGWYTVSSLDIRGLNTQGRTIEEAIENARDAATLLTEDRQAMMNEVRTASKIAGGARKKTASRTATAPSRRKGTVKA